jgi:phage repressor protein C with HTH and peptisase S24 domain
MNIDDIRHANLSALIQIHGGQRMLADTTNKNPAQISQWVNRSPDSKTGKPRVLSSQSARSLESSLELPSGWMDVTHTPDEMHSIERHLTKKISEAIARGPVPPQGGWLRPAFLRRMADRNSTALSTDHPEPSSSAETRDGYVRLGLLDGVGDMGDGAENVDFPEVIREMEFSEIQLRNLIGFLPRAGRLKLMTGRGISMDPLIRSGDVVIVDTGCQSFEGDGVYVINTGRGQQIKTLQDRGDALYVVSANSEFFPAFKAPDDIAIGGKVYVRNRLERLD